MNLNKFAKEVHQNAVDHGFWEDERDITETIALIHSDDSGFTQVDDDELPF